MLAGDIGEDRSGARWARTRLRESGRGHGGDVLGGEEPVVSGVRFLGATLWTDFAVGGESPANVDQAMRQCADAMTDYHVIRR